MASDFPSLDDAPPAQAAAALPSAARLPRIVAVGRHRLGRVLEALAPAYRSVARIEVLQSGFDAAVETLQAAHRASPIDVLVAAGSNGAHLRQRLDIPVALVQVHGFDLMTALAAARAVSPRVALVTFGDRSPEVERFDALFGLGIVQRAYRTEDEARQCVRALRAAGIEAVVAPGLVADLAEAAGMAGVFLYSDRAVRQALDEALDIARRGRIAEAKRERLGAILGQLQDGVVAVDLDERIETVNPAMARILGAPAEDLRGRRLGEVEPLLGLRATLLQADPTPEAVVQLGARTLVVRRMPIVEQGVHTGAVLACQDQAAVQRADRSLRALRQRQSAAPRHRLEEIAGDGPASARLRLLAGQCAASDATVLVTGESGTGKELVAQGIHSAGRRARQPFVAINCAALAEALLESELFGYEEGAFTGARRGGKAGLLETAHTGTVFLDEIGDMPLALQSRLLRVLQEREVLRIGATEPVPVDLRVIAATHRDLAAEVARGGFRRDLYYRLAILRIAVAPLRERREDLPAIAARLQARIAGRLGMPDGDAAPLVAALLDRTRRHDWPGNVRELENLVERVLAHRDYLAPGTPGWEARLAALVPETADRPESGVVSASASSAAATPGSARDHALAVLADCGGNRRLACERLGISRATLWRRLRAAGTPDPGPDGDAGFGSC